MPLISEDYRKLQSTLHDQRADYGVASVGYAPTVKDLADQVQPTSLLDYGAGKQRLRDTLAKLGCTVPVVGYDPAIEAISADPGPADLVTCIDVLEHIEPEFLDTVLDDLQRLTRQFGFFTIHTGPAVKVLADGRNAHLIQEPKEWWIPKMAERFKILHVRDGQDGFSLIVRHLSV